MFRIDREVFGLPVLRLLLILWGVGYVQVDIGATLLGRTPPGFMFLTNLPLFALGVGLSLMLCGVITATDGWPGWRRWPLVSAVILIASCLQTIVDLNYLKMLALTVLPEWRTWALKVDGMRFGMVHLLYTWTFVLSALMIWASRVTDQARMNEARAAAFEAAALRAEAAALRLQLNPHFLFNTLNGIASLVVAGREQEAEEMISRLADFLRASLVSDPNRNVTLVDEMETVTAYLRIEEARFRDRLTTRFILPSEAGERLVPNFILQPLIENAVKHGVAPSRRPVEIEVRADLEGGMLVLTVANRALGGRAGRSHERTERIGIGLENTRQRLMLAYGERAWIVSETTLDGFRVSLGLPDVPPETPASTPPRPGATQRRP